MNSNLKPLVTVNQWSVFGALLGGAVLLLQDSLPTMVAAPIMLLWVLLGIVLCRPKAFWEPREKPNQSDLRLYSMAANQVDQLIRSSSLNLTDYERAKLIQSAYSELKAKETGDEATHS